MSSRRIGVYICFCGGNISDYVDCERVREAIKDEEDVVTAKTAMFTCSDATQQEIIDDIREEKLDALVVASCSPTLHRFTFRGVAKRADLNPYQYVQVNLREQCSWAHTDNLEHATEKAVLMVRAGIAKARFTEPLEEIRIDTVPSVLVIGAGISGLRASLALSDLGLSVFLLEKTDSIGGAVAKFGRMYPHDQAGEEVINSLANQVKERRNITVYTGAKLIEKTGCVGNFNVKLRITAGTKNDVSLNVGAIIVCTGFESYTPEDGEFAYGTDGVLLLSEFKELLDKSNGRIEYSGKEVKDITYIYCVGSREDESKEHANTYCSRYCCNAAVHASSLMHDLSPDAHQFHLFKDMRTYGKYELLYENAREKGAVFIKFADEEPPLIEKSNGELKVRVKDILTSGEELEIETDLVVLVTGMIPPKNDALVDVLKIPVGLDGFFKEVHPKLRPVETVIDGVMIAGACQAPRNSSESVASALAAAAKSASLLMKGYVELEPLIATLTEKHIDWDDEYSEICSYSAIEKVETDGKQIVGINRALCKGCGGCVPLFPDNTIEIKGYSDKQIKSMIDSMVREI
jgi:heterodisulfide reductase subunit A